MHKSQQIAKHVKGIYFGGNWAAANLKQHLDEVSWEMAIYKLHNINTIATLAYHINYFVAHVSIFLEGDPLTSKDKLSFNHPPIKNQEDWIAFRDNLWKDGSRFIKNIESIPEDKWDEVFIKEEYGNYFSNIIGIIEHAHYHLGQIVLLKKMIKNTLENKNG